jgi:3-dehydroquinate dehydratase-2
MKILVINGPNLNLLGKRNVKVYGEKSLEEIGEELIKEANRVGIELEMFQSNHEGEIIDRIHNFSGVDGIIINPGALCHYSYSLRDAIEAVPIPVIEVHISNIFSREEFRSRSVTAGVCRGFISGFGWKVYLFALHIIYNILKNGNP